MREAELPAVTDIFRLAFGTFLGVPDPQTFWADRDYTGTRWRRPIPTRGSGGRSANGLRAGSNFAANCGEASRSSAR